MLRDAWLTDTGFKRPGIKKGLPLREAEAKASMLDGQIRRLAKPHSAETTAPCRGEWTGERRTPLEEIDSHDACQSPSNPLKSLS